VKAEVLTGRVTRAAGSGAGEADPPDVGEADPPDVGKADPPDVGEADRPDVGEADRPGGVAEPEGAAVGVTETSPGFALGRTSAGDPDDELACRTATSRAPERTRLAPMSASTRGFASPLRTVRRWSCRRSITVRDALRRGL
jgi:hypothetical protein